MRELTEEQVKEAEQKSRDEEGDKKDGVSTLDQRLAQIHYWKTLVPTAGQKADGAFKDAGLEGLRRLLGDHIRGFDKSPEGAFKLHLDEVVHIGGLVFDTTVGGKLGADGITQLSGVRAEDGRIVDRMSGDEDTVVAHTDSQPIRLTPADD